MNIGKLYQVKKLYWMLFPSKEIATVAEPLAAYCSKKYNCNVSYISPKSIFVFLEQDEKVIKILTTNGELGWINLYGWCKDDIEEVNQ
jgi:hypothetical protein